MRRFDLLGPVFGAHIIEASAGTGKTYAIENLVARLTQEGLKIEEILVVTFTKAATQELKQRIRAKLGKDVLLDFDKAKIFTIHGFCYRMLKHHMFFDLPDPDETNNSQARKRAVLEVLRKLAKNSYTPEEIHLILKKHRFNIESLVTRLVNLGERRKKIEGTDPFLKLARECAVQIQKQEAFSPDDLLHKMEECLENPEFVKSVRQMFRAVIVDEFQDTDPLQWKIFEKLFVNAGLDAFYLVGDPKQSIYRFRGADVYTYLKAKEHFPSHYLLDTNYRSDPTFIKRLNALFSKCPLALPKEDETLDYAQVNHKPDGIDHPFKDGKDPFCFFKVEAPKASAKAIEEEYLFPFITQEILYLKEEENFPLNKIAVLIKDRHQAERVCAFLNNYNIPSQLKKGGKITDRLSYQALKELKSLLENPDSLSKLKIVLSGPLFNWDHHQLKDAHTMKAFFQDKGLVEIMREIDFSDKEVLEFVLKEKEECEEKRSCSGREEIQIMSTHMSKGLEFDIVFALGSASRHSGKDDYIEVDNQIIEYTEENPLCKLHEKEDEAEKLRQLYVTLTRAKKRVYIPLIHGKKLGSESPIELFCKYVNIESSINLNGMEFQLHPLQLPEPEAKEIPRPVPSEPSFIYSFTSLAQKGEAKSVEIDEAAMPTGKETGVLLHSILEEIFQADDRLEYIKQKVEKTHLENWSQQIFEMIEKSLQLLDIPKTGYLQEMEFMYPQNNDLIKGSVDLVFIKEGSYYLVDWKSNYLTDYSQVSLEKEMKQSDYFLQAEIYVEALKRHVKLFDINLKYGGAYYIFLRGPAIYHVNSIK